VAEVTVRCRQGLIQQINAGGHQLIADEPQPLSGDRGPNPYELLLSALGACTAMTVRMYAEHKHWPLREIEIVLNHDRIHAEDCAECETHEGFLDRISKRISFEGDLTDEQRQRLAEIAERCPVQRTLQREIVIEQTLG